MTPTTGGYELIIDVLALKARGIPVVLNAYYLAVSRSTLRIHRLESIAVLESRKVVDILNIFNSTTNSDC